MGDDAPPLDARPDGIPARLQQTLGFPDAVMQLMPVGANHAVMSKLIGVMASGCNLLAEA
jgi:hypothetical protein